MTAVEERLRDALVDEADALDESDDLFARVALSIEDDRRLRRQRRRRIAVDRLPGRRDRRPSCSRQRERTKGELVMDWWVLELMWFAGMVFLALWLGPFIRRFGKSYAADVFRANPADRQELHRADGRRVLPDLLRVHPVHGAVRARRRTGPRR